MTKRIDDMQLERLRVILAHTTYEMHGLAPATRPPQDNVLVARGLLREHTLQTIVTDAIIDTDGSAAGQTIAWSRSYVTLTPLALDYLLDEVTAADRQIVMLRDRFDREGNVEWPVKINPHL